MPDSTMNMPNLVLMSALSCEAKPLIDFYKLKKVADGPFPMFAGSEQQVMVCISGIGGLNMAAAVAYVAASLPSYGAAWLNLGIAGHEWLELGSVRRVHGVQAVTDSKAFYPSLAVRSKLDSCPCLSVNSPSGEYHGDTLIDMEAAAFFEVATKFCSSERVQSLKVVSDNLEHDFASLTAQSISDLVHANLSELTEFVDALIDFCSMELDIETPGWVDQLQGTHSQQQLLRSKLQTLAVLNLKDELLNLNASDTQKIDQVLPALDSILSQHVPSLLAND